MQYPPQPSEISGAEIYAFEKANGIEFDAKQRQAIEIAVNKGLLILTGGPGTGKTTTVKGIISLMKNRGLDVALAAPTGRAAKRMTELTGQEAKTVHRLLEVEYRDGSDEPVLFTTAKIRWMWTLLSWMNFPWWIFFFLIPCWRRCRCAPA